MIPPQTRIYVCTEVVDMRLGFDRLACAVRQRLGGDPESGALFVFANRRGTRLKVLWAERNGYCLLYKRLHRAVFELPTGTGESLVVQINAAGLARLLAGTPKSRGSRNPITRR